MHELGLSGVVNRENSSSLSSSTFDTTAVTSDFNSASDGVLIIDPNSATLKQLLKDLINK